MLSIPIHPSAHTVSTTMYAGKDLLASPFLREFFSAMKGKLIVCADCALLDLYATPLAEQIGATLLPIKRGERAKSHSAAKEVMEKLFAIGAGKDTTLIALGGGVTTDLVGFVASLYMRGLSLVLIPTTLLGMVDAAIGGKTAIDLAFGKNLIGTIYHPKAIFADFATLETLPEREWVNGFAEILKMGLIRDASLWEMAQSNRKDATLISQAIYGKVAIVEQDAQEEGLRKILNFGHTIGHALEAVAQYEMPHGEAVALGCLAESYLSKCLGYLSEKEFNKIQAMYASFSLRLPKTYLRSKLFKAMAHDKKKVLGQIRFVLIDRIGHALSFGGAYCRAVSMQELESTLDWMEESYLCDKN